VPNQMYSVLGCLCRCIMCYRSMKYGKTTKESNDHNKYINFTELQQHFVSVQDKHHQQKQAAREKYDDFEHSDALSVTVK